MGIVYILRKEDLRGNPKGPGRCRKRVRRKDLVQRCAKYLWAVLQPHQVMKSFSEQRFQNHTAIAPVVKLGLTLFSTKFMNKPEDIWPNTGSLN